MSARFDCCVCEMEVLISSHRKLLSSKASPRAFPASSVVRWMRALMKILAGAPISAIDLWAVHPGGRSILDAVERALHLAPSALSASRHVLRRYGNMSSAAVMFVLHAILHSQLNNAAGCAISFGPGLIAETMRFHTAAMMA